MKYAIWTTLLATLVLLSAAPGALAHAGNPNYRSVIDKVTPDVPDVTFQVLSYDSFMQLLDQHGHEVTVYGYENEPYARILRDGTVQVNQRSPATYLNDSRFEDSEPPPIADPKAPPRWKTVDDSGTFIWHEDRMHSDATGVPPEVTDPGRKTKIFDYEVPIQIDGHKGAIAGTLFWVGSPEASKLPFILGGLVIVLAGGALVLLSRRRRREDADRGAQGSGAQN